MATHDTPKKKLTLYFPEELLGEALREARRQDRSISWILQAAWRLARERIRAYPSSEDEVGGTAGSTMRG